MHQSQLELNWLARILFTREYIGLGILSSDEGEWRPARQLRVGSEVKLASGIWARVLEIERRTGEFTVYNFEVADNHNYFVGQNGLLVHNQCWLEIREAAKKLANDLLKAAKEAQRGTGPKSGESGNPFMQAARELRELQDAREGLAARIQGSSKAKNSRVCEKGTRHQSPL